MRPRPKPLLVLLVKRAVLFLTVMSALSVFLYAVGTAQDFLESTQSGLIRLSALFGLLLAVASSYGFLLDVSYALFLRRRRLLWGALAYLFSAAFGFTVALAANGILVLTAGNLS